MKELEIKVADCSCDTLIRTAKKCSFNVKQGRRHCKVKTIDGRFVTTIPRHSRLKRELVKDVIDKFNQFGIVKIVVK